MNYGPLCEAIDKFIMLAAQYTERQKRDPGSDWESQRRRYWRNIEVAQDQFYEDVKNGRISKD
jgi:hypothetical protein